MKTGLDRPLSIFVQRASECLTDHESHGDGLICFSLLNGLAERGHKIFAYTNRAPINSCSPNLQVKTARHVVPANSLAPWEHSWRANRWMSELATKETFDLVWRMHPYRGGCPSSPLTLGKPLVVGPLFYGWPEAKGHMSAYGRPRLGIGLSAIVGPVADHGWMATLRNADLIMCATGRHAALINEQFPENHVIELPVIVELPTRTTPRISQYRKGSVKLVFIANLVPNKNPIIFCSLIAQLLKRGIKATGIVLGDGPERTKMEDFIAVNGLDKSIFFQGKVPNNEVYGYLSASDFLVSTSVGEPYGRSIAEAMSAGTPCVCHWSGGPADFICDGADGLLVNDLSAEAYASRIESAISSPDTWPKLAANARLKAENWRRDVVLDRLEDSLLNTISRSGRGLS